ncbi:MAG: HIT family hydrolase [Candidatus Omnitrophica bacterium CG1_02_44_16]|nr:MAG: HIT family hydrolase [Candidatus Omnitrophica bacterium CG1_02_44_16]PIY83289.1 MAG: HIT family hydrolase [Candidatus Omnitrophica bacterium CG_4_10_14_0_8_um_filter_44_12]PIZ84516.1 MAG: HIT family hydrolase [Candidatus Omnitrophica bacterium CG_4_10_14_0_2_um_filter_44_9]
MEKLWAPWRMSYIKNAKKEKGCLFCRVLKSKKDKANLVLLRSKHSFAVLNLYPYNNGHLMASPKRHVSSIELLNDDEICDLFNTVKKAKLLLEAALKPEGYNIGLNEGRAAGAGIVGHMHVHIVPRWNGDTNFMPIFYNTKIISRSLNELYEKLTSGRK